MAERLVVIGGDAAGMSAASQARRRRGPHDLEIVAFERGTVTSYSACGIPYWIGGAVDDRDALIARRPETFRERFDIDVRLRHEAVGIDTTAGTVRVHDLESGSERDEPYDQLLVATGADPFRPPLEGIDGEGIFGIQTLDHGQAVLDALADRRPERAAVVGGGYIGLEMAEAMVERGVAVTLVDMAPQPMTTLDPDMGSLVADAMRSIGIALRLGTPVEGFELDGDGRLAAVVTADETLPADLVVLGLGTRPASRLARDAGIPIGATGGIVTDRRQRTRVDGIWAAGDCTETFDRVSGRPVAIALGTVANKQGRVAGINLGGGYLTFPGVVGTAATKVCGAEIARTGLTEAAAADVGFDAVTATIESTTRAGYYPGAGRITVKLLAERGSGRLLGGQLVGFDRGGSRPPETGSVGIRFEGGAAKRIDVLALALWNGMRADELMQADLSYAPPFSPLWDPVLIAARKVHEAATGQVR